MDPTPFFIMGTAFGTAATLLIQGYGRRKVQSAIGDNPDTQAKIEEHETVVTHLRDRIAILERIATDPSHSLDREIESLRVKAN